MLIFFFFLKVIDFVFFGDPVAAGCFQFTLTKCTIKLYLWESDAKVRNEWCCSQPKSARFLRATLAKTDLKHPEDGCQEISSSFAVCRTCTTVL